ncbi:MAG TPA: hypothetical protein VFQ40_08160 [Actinomycetota bacterium]|nr:hypothetical protein [Actinomycetota bacterium]
MRTARTLVATLLVFAVGATGCTGEPERRRHGEVEGCEFVPTGDRVGDVPAGVDGTASDDVWVVGAAYKGGTSDPYAARWNGERWTRPPIEPIEAEIGGLADVAAVRADDAVAVGSVRSREPIAFRWDGERWRGQTIRAFPTEEAELFGVAAAGREAWAVGRSRVGRRWHTLVMRSAGRAWARVGAPTPPGLDAALRGIDASGPDDVWAVGWTAAPGGELGALALHHDGERWRRVPTPDVEGWEVIGAVDAVGPDEAWAVGWSIGDDGVDRPLVLRWDGGSWTEVEIPALEGRAQLLGVSAPGPDDAWAVGRMMDDTQTFVSLVLRWDGRRWSVVPTPDVAAEDDTLVGIAVVDGFPWTVGSALGEDQRYRSLLLSGC